MGLADEKHAGLVTIDGGREKPWLSKDRSHMGLTAVADRGESGLGKPCSGDEGRSISRSKVLLIGGTWAKMTSGMATAMWVY